MVPTTKPAKSPVTKPVTVPRPATGFSLCVVTILDDIYTGGVLEGVTGTLLTVVISGVTYVFEATVEQDTPRTPGALNWNTSGTVINSYAPDFAAAGGLGTILGTALAAVADIVVPNEGLGPYVITVTAKSGVTISSASTDADPARMTVALS
jgi:hypothetical protein